MVEVPNWLRIAPSIVLVEETKYLEVGVLKQKAVQDEEMLQLSPSDLYLFYGDAFILAPVFLIGTE